MNLIDVLQDEKLRLSKSIFGKNKFSQIEDYAWPYQVFSSFAIHGKAWGVLFITDVFYHVGVETDLESYLEKP